MEDLHFLRLWDIYNPLLTENQREITDLYFNCDLSLAEIAEQKGVSRQSVSDCLNKCRRQLEEYEEKLGFARTLTEISLEQSFLTTDVSRLAETLPSEQRQALERILKKDYTIEVRKAIEENAIRLL